MTTTLHLLCAGAAQGLVQALRASFETETGVALHARFGAVGAMKEALLAGDPCDVMVVTQAMVDGLVGEGHLHPGTSAALGRVRTGIAVPDPGAVHDAGAGPLAAALPPDVSTPEALHAALRSATAIYFPDAERSTAGIHFAGVMRQLGLHDELQSRLKTFPNGATAMRAMADSGDPGAIGCTQVSEILYTVGVRLVAPLPPRFELSTTYSAAVAVVSEATAQAAHFIALLTGAPSASKRAVSGFES